MKLTALFLLISFSAFAQDKVYRVHTDTDDTLLLIRYNHSATIPVSDGLVYKWKLPANDTARFFNATDGQYEATVTFRKLGTTDPEPTIEKVDGEAATFSSGWRHGATIDTAWYQKTIAYSNTPGETATYAFTGTGIELHSETKPGHGAGTITLLRGTEVIETKQITFITDLVKFTKVYEKKGLPSGTYTLRLTVSGGYNLIDYFVVYK